MHRSNPSLPRLHWWAVKCVQGIRKGVCSWTLQSPACSFSNNFFSLFCNSFDKTCQSKRMVKGRTIANMKKNKWSLTRWKKHGTTTLAPNDFSQFPAYRGNVNSCVASGMETDEMNCWKEADICPSSQSNRWFWLLWNKEASLLNTHTSTAVGIDSDYSIYRRKCLALNPY